MRIIDRRGEERPGEKRWRALTRTVPGAIFVAVGLFLFGIEGCAAVEVSTGRARVDSAWFWLALSGFGGYFLLAGLEVLVIGTKRLIRPLYVVLAGAARAEHPDRSIPPAQPETPGERALWQSFWGSLRRRLRGRR
ncbi:MAG: hypothetical protein KIT16_13630 [Rhodospirillaceae bacterium]|nr:hypothetical protein [Rhodospirillaceae bacterium]